jgi:hypothetical protein
MASSDDVIASSEALDENVGRESSEYVIAGMVPCPMVPVVWLVLPLACPVAMASLQ